MLNKFSLIYAIIAACGTMAGLLASFSCLAYWWKHGRARSMPEVKLNREAWLHLGLGGLLLALFLHLLLVPLWFLMLQSFVSAVPGAICMIGVHQNVPAVAWTASVFKLVVPAVCLTWIIAEQLDRKDMHQTLLSFRVYMFGPLALFFIVAAGLDFLFLVSVDTTNQVGCCLAPQNQEPTPLAQFAGNSKLYLIFAIATLLMLTGFLLKQLRGRGYAALGAFGNILFLFLLACSLQTRLTSIYLPGNLPLANEHQCIFCLFLTSPLVVAGFALSWAGSSLGFAAYIIRIFLVRRKDAGQPRSRLNNYFRLSVIISWSGTVLLLVSL